jgi:hypothetical protein
VVAAVVSGVQVPRIRYAPAYESSRGSVAIEVAERCGLTLDEWQREALVDACACDDAGRWVAFEVGLNVARQNGKGGTLEARELAGITDFGERLIVHSSHEFATSMVAMDRMEELLEEGGLISELRPRGGILRSHGSEGFRFKTGQRIWYRTRTKGGGRGFSADLVILDEAMILQEAFIGALMPTMSARSITGNPQMWYTGSAVDQLVHEHGLVFARLRDRGLRGDDPSLVYLEWSADPGVDSDGVEVELGSLDAALLSSAAAWAQANPGLGIRISPDHVAKELRSMDARTFAVERLGIGDWPPVHTVNGEVISVDDWNALFDPASVVIDPVRFAYDVKPDRSVASISVAGLRADGLRHVELVDRRKGTGWVADRLAELVSHHGAPGGVICDPYGPAGSLVNDIEEAGVEVQKVTAREHADACGMIFDLVEQQGLRHLGQGEFAAAIKGVKKRPLGDAWAWSRKGGVDITPLVSGTLALWGVSTLEVEAEPFAEVW